MWLQNNYRVNAVNWNTSHHAIPPPQMLCSCSKRALSCVGTWRLAYVKTQSDTAVVEKDGRRTKMLIDLPFVARLYSAVLSLMRYFNT